MLMRMHNLRGHFSLRKDLVHRMSDLSAHHLHQALISDLVSPNQLCYLSPLNHYSLQALFKRPHLVHHVYQRESPLSLVVDTLLASALAFLNSIVTSSSLNKSQLQHHFIVFSLLLSPDARLVSAT